MRTKKYKLKLIYDENELSALILSLVKRYLDSLSEEGYTWTRPHST